MVECANTVDSFIFVTNYVTTVQGNAIATLSPDGMLNLIGFVYVKMVNNRVERALVHLRKLN